MNSVILIGRLTKDPEIRYTTGSQMAVATFSVAVDRPTRQGEEKKADFPRITVFGRQAENCEKYLSKGKKVAIEGRIQTGSYQKQNGETVYTTDVVANRVEFIDWGQQEHHAGGYSGGYQTQRPPEAYQPQVQQQMTMPQATSDPEPYRARPYPGTEVPPQFEQIAEDVPF